MFSGKRVPLITVVDDDAHVRKALQRLMRSAGFDVETFSTGEDFIQIAQIHPPDCLLLDLNLPGMSGTDVLRQLKETGLNFPVIVITGELDTSPAEKSVLAKAAGVLLKPAETENVLNAIQDAWRSQ